MNPGTYAMADMRTSQVCGSGLSNTPGIPISMARVGDMGTIVSISGREETRKFLEQDMMDDFTHNKAIQKIRESYRVSREEKEELNRLKRR